MHDGSSRERVAKVLELLGLEANPCRNLGRAFEVIPLRKDDQASLELYCGTVSALSVVRETGGAWRVRLEVSLQTVVRDGFLRSVAYLIGFTHEESMGRFHWELHLVPGKGASDVLYFESVCFSGR